MANQATQYRVFLYLFTLVGLVCFYVAYKGAQGLFAPELGVTVAALGILCLLAGGWYGMKGARLRIAEREKKADAIALVTLAAFLKDKSEEELQAAVAKGGPAGEAARLVLERRRTGLTRPSQQVPSQPEIN